MNSIIDAALSHSRTVLSILMLLTIGGIYSYVTIPKESDPDISIPIIYVSMSLEGISPEDSERLLIRPMEKELSSIEGVKEMRATAFQGGGNVVLEFTAGFDDEKAMDDVREAVDKGKPELPTEADEPSVNEVNLSLFPVLIVTLSGDIPERTLLTLAKNLQDKIETIPTVLEAAIAGDREELVEIVLDPELMAAYNLSGTEIITFFQASNRLVAAGNLDTGAGRFAIEVPGLFENVTDVLDMPLRVKGDAAIRVRDIAHIRKTYKDPENYARLAGQKAIALEIVKRSGENIIDTIEAVKLAVEEEKAYWPEGIVVSFSQDRSSDIRDMLKDLQNNIISAVILVMVVVIAALGVRASLLVGVAIPGAFLTGILIIYTMGLTINVVVLFSLILSVGMLVDGAIVVTEYADRKMSEGHHKRVAYAMAAKRMAWPIIASTATTLAAFAPLLFWPGMVGQFMKYMPVTLIAVLSASLLMALIFVPTLGAIFGKHVPDKDEDLDLKVLNSKGKTDLHKLHGMSLAYVNILESALKRPFLIVAIAIGMLIGVQVAYGAYGKGVEFFPNIEPTNASVLVHARGNLSIDEKDALVKEVEDIVLTQEGLKTIYTRTGAAAGAGSDLAEDVIGQIQLEFTDWQSRPTAGIILEEIRGKTAHLAGIMVEAQKQKEGPQAGKAIEIQLASRFPELIEPTLVAVREKMEEDDRLIDIEDSRTLPGVQWKMEIDRAQAAKFGVDLTTVGNYIRLITNGLKIAEYRPDDSDEEIDIVIRHDTGDRTLDQLDRIRVEKASGSIPVSSFMSREAKPAVGNIYRSNQKRILTIKADVREGINATMALDGVKAWLEENREKLDPRVEITFKGQDEDQKEAGEFLIKAFIIALFVMAIILVTQFNSFYQAFLILSAVIMSTIGVMLGLLITGQPFGIVMSGVGVIALAGIIVNNNIVLIDTYSQLMKSGQFSRYDAIVRTGAQRLRPVLLTTVTTVLGLMPMVLQMNIDFITREVSIGAPSTQWWVQLASAVAFGLVFSTMLTLVLTPCALLLPEVMREKLQTLQLKKRMNKLLGLKTSNG